MSEQWFAVHVRSRLEAYTCAALSTKGYRTFLPTRTMTRRAQNQKKQSLALFPGYVFCQFDARYRLPILQTSGVIQVVGSGKTPLPVDETELEYVKRIAAAGANAIPVDYLEIGQRIRIDHGPLSGVEGVLAEIKNSKKLVISITLLRRSVAVEIEPECLALPDPARWWTVAAAAATAPASTKVTFLHNPGIN